MYEAVSLPVSLDCKSSAFVQETTDGAYICSWLIFKDHLLVHSSLKNDLSWRPGSHTKVVTSPHGWTRSSRQNLNGKGRILEVAAGAEVLQKYWDIAQVCRDEFMKARAHQELNLSRASVPAGISAAKLCWQCKFLQEPACVPLKEDT